MVNRWQYQARSPLFWILATLAFAFVVWCTTFRAERPLHDPDSPPRPVTARGDLAADEKNAIEIFQSVSPSVVFITTLELRRDLFSLDISEMPSGTGSGFVWDTEGRIVTNYHVIQGASRVAVTLFDHSTWKAAVVGVAPEKDLAVLQVQTPSEVLKPIPVGESRDLLVGQRAYAIGNPFGLDYTMTSGIVSALDREIKSVTGRTIQGVIQTDAAINPGNSGGPLLDSAGRLIGVNTAIYSPSGASAGIGFAVPADVVNRVVPDLIRHGRLIRPGIGITVANERIAQRLGIEGVIVITVLPGGPAEAAGIQGARIQAGEVLLGDIIKTVNGVPVLNFDDLKNKLDQYRVGDEIELGIERDGKPLSVRIRLEATG